MRNRALQLVVMFSIFVGPALAEDAAMIAAAKREGSVTVYTTLVINQLVRPMADAFQARYGVKVNPVRADPAEIVRRVTAEAKAGRFEGDVFDGTTTAPALAAQDLVLKWTPENAANLPKDFVDAQGHWFAMYVLVSTPAVNTQLVKAADEPKSWQDLLQPRWKGKMIWSGGTASTGSVGFVALALRELGPDRGRAYLSELASQNVVSVPSATRQILDQVIAGEYELSIMSSVHQVLFSASEGAPIKYIPVSPAALSIVSTSVAKNAPHPNAAKLYVEFLLSDQGQTIFRDNYYIPASTRVKAKDPEAFPDGSRFRGHFFSPEELVEKTPDWLAIFRQYFR